MAFVELDRHFISLDPEQSYRPDEFDALRFFRSGHLTWPDLLKTPRVVLLAGAASGKSEEFRQRAAAIRRDGGLGLYITIERLEAAGIDGSLKIDDRTALAAWRRGAEPGWFFLDSIDEARINHKDVELALNRFANDLGEAYDRARILLSCRGSAWAGDADLAVVTGALPVRGTPLREDRQGIDPDEALFAKREKPSGIAGDQTEAPRTRLVTLAPIDRAQRAAFLTAERATDIPAFEEALFNQGLDTLAERPGDLRTLARYWSKHERFGSLTEMVEFGIGEHLRETNDKRRSAAMISDEQARHGAERLAAAMTLGRSMDLVLPNAEGIDARSVDPHLVLEDWTPNDVDGLLQRGLFVPSTFGRVRFFHRTVQEYLAARWFERLMPGLTDAELYRIFLADRFGVKTIPPALRATAAWIAAGHAGLRGEILAREPLVALAEGDPGALPIADRRALLLAFASKQAAGEVSYRSIDHRSLWMFADEELAPSIIEALAINDRPEFRFEMLRLIEEGGIGGCIDFVRASALGTTASPYHRIVATRILAKLKDDAGLAAVAADVLSATHPLPAKLTPSLAVQLFPGHLSVDQLLLLIAKTTPARQFQLEGFRDELVQLHAACSARADRLKLVGGIAALAFQPPLGDWPQLSSRNATLVANAGPLARAAILDADQHGVSTELVAILRAVGMAREDDRDEQAPLGDLVVARSALKQALFWADLEAERAKREAPVRKLHEIGSGGDLLWRIGAEDRSWLTEALRRPEDTDRVVALDALARLAAWSDDSDAAFNELAAEVAGDPVLVRMLEDIRASFVKTAADIAREAKRHDYDRRREAEEDRRRRDLLSLRKRVQADPAALSDHHKLAYWPGPLPLLELTRWIGGSLGGGYSDAATAWDALRPAFGDDVAHHYAAGMKLLWRVTPPERPTHRKGLRTIKWTSILSMAGLSLEATEEGWADRLEAEAADRAVRHVCLDDQTIPDWLGSLIEAHPRTATSPVAAEILREWRGGGEYAQFLERAAHGLPLVEPLRSALMVMLKGPPPGHVSRIGTAADLLVRLKPSEGDLDGLAAIASRRLRFARNAGEWQTSLAYLRLLFRLRPKGAAEQLFEMLELERGKRARSRAPELLRALFDQHRGSVVEPSVLGADTLGRLTTIAYGLRRPRRSQGVDEDAIDFHDPADALLSALISLDGEDAYRATLDLAGSRSVGASRHRMRELARGIAERGADRPPWKERDVQRFESSRLAPIGTGEDLLELVCSLIDQIGWGFRNADMSARSVIQTAKDEDAVQEWLGATLQEMGGGRFVCHKEAHVAGAKRPDIKVTATTASVEVAIEVKHDEKGWTVPDLRRALRLQLAEQYLKPANRRHGVLVITNHRAAKFWRDPEHRRRLRFADVISSLAREAATMPNNSAGMIGVEVRGIDAAE